MTWTLPTALAKLTLPALVPPMPILAVTRFGTVWFGAKFRFDAVGAVVPAGKTVRKEALLPSVTVTFMTTATALVGTPVDAPVTIRSRVLAAVSGVDAHPPRPPRESRMRAGTSGT